MGEYRVLYGTRNIFFFNLFYWRPSAPAHRDMARPAFGALDGQFTQGSVQIELIFRLLLKITVDWPFHAISLFLKPARAPSNQKKKN